MTEYVLSFLASWGAPMIAGLALVVSVGTLLWTIASFRERRRIDGLVSNLNAIFKLHEELGKDAQLLRFHHVTSKELEEAGITLAELGYLTRSFTAGGLYHKIVYPRDRSPFTSGSYRDWMCRSPNTRKAWPVLKRFTSDSAYRARIEATMLQYGKEQLAD